MPDERITGIIATRSKRNVNKHMNKVFAVLVLGLCVLTGCYYDNEEELYPVTSTTSGQNDTIPVTYAGDIAPMIAANCATSGCHVANAQVPDLSDYAKLSANITRVKVRAIDLKTMPASGPLSSANIEKLRKWIDAGALNN
jgi:hypothetical protein